MFQKNITTGEWRWIDANWSEDWECPHASMTDPPYHVVRKGKGSGTGEPILTITGENVRGWTMEEAEHFAAQYEEMLAKNAATPKAAPAAPSQPAKEPVKDD